MKPKQPQPTVRVWCIPDNLAEDLKTLLFYKPTASGAKWRKALKARFAETFPRMMDENSTLPKEVSEARRWAEIEETTKRYTARTPH